MDLVEDSDGFARADSDRLRWRRITGTFCRDERALRASRTFGNYKWGKRAIPCLLCAAMPVLRIGMLVCLLCLLGASGCSPCGWLVKRQSEQSCPTDIRQTVPWCVGEDAIFHCPCGPDRSFYGYKPTCWGVWPAPAAEWRDARCGPCPNHYEGEERGYPPTELPTLAPDDFEEFAPEATPAREILRGQESDGTFPERPVPEASSSGSWPTERISGPLWPKTAAYAQTPAKSQPTETISAQPRQEQMPQRQLSNEQADRVGNAPMLPERLIVFRQSGPTKAAARQNIPRDTQFTW